MKLHVKHLKSNKKSIFFPSIILLISFLGEKKKEKKKGKKENKFPIYKDVWLSHPQPMSSLFLTSLSSLPPNPTQVLLPVNMKIAIIRQGWGFLACTKEGKAAPITQEHSLPLSAHKHLFSESKKDKGRNYCSFTMYAKFIRAAFNT